MRKGLFLTGALLLGASIPTIAQEVTYVEDPSQGYLINKATSNWFVSADGGVNFLLGKEIQGGNLKDNIGSQGAIYVGKWVTPVVGARLGYKFLNAKGDLNLVHEESAIDPKKINLKDNQAKLDLLINLTNWFCGYKSGRTYNAVAHLGGGYSWINQSLSGVSENLGETGFINLGLQNSVRVWRNLDIYLDLGYDLFRCKNYSNVFENFAVSLGATVNIGTDTWNSPITAVCPVWKYTDAEGDALVARLAQAEAKITSLQTQLDECMKNVVKETPVVKDVATLYYPINRYDITSREKIILKSVAAVMKENSSKHYILTGWADNYTGTEKVNNRIRTKRVEGVKNYLLKCGVSASQIDVRTDAANLTDFGLKGAPMDRAVTIKLAD